MNFDIKITKGAAFIAQDKNGEWWSYTHKPSIDIKAHKWNTGHPQRNNYRICNGYPPKDWTQELYIVE